MFCSNNFIVHQCDESLQKLVCVGVCIENMTSYSMNIYLLWFPKCFLFPYELTVYSKDVDMVDYGLHALCVVVRGPPFACIL